MSYRPERSATGIGDFLSRGGSPPASPPFAQVIRDGAARPTSPRLSTATGLSAATSQTDDAQLSLVSEFLPTRARSCRACRPFREVEFCRACRSFLETGRYGRIQLPFLVARDDSSTKSGCADFAGECAWQRTV